MKKILLILLLFTFSLTLISQTSTPVLIQKRGQINVKKAINSDWKVKVSNLEAPSPDGDSYQNMLQRKKAEIDKKYPRNGSSRESVLSLDDTIGIGKSFLSNINSHGVPNDNSMAISNDGIVISAFNSAIFIRDTENDTTLGEISLHQFSNQIGEITDNYDPKMIYDPESDRFILIYLIGRLAINSKIAIAFSQTNDPMGVWNIYTVSGNPMNDVSWSDYPAISITKQDLFITINLLEENKSWQTAFKQTVVWQIEKGRGYNNYINLDSYLWHNIKQNGLNLRNMHPVRGGFDIKSKEQYFISNRNFATESDSIYLVKIDNTITSGIPKMTVKLIHADKKYHMAPNAKQGSGKWFATNDSRVLGAIIENGKIQFVQNCLNKTTGTCSVYHGVISNLNSTPTIKANLITDNLIDFGYPNITYGGLIANEDKALIGFNHSSKTVFAGNSAIYFNDGNYSKRKIVKAGESIVRYRVGFNSLIRWGDYFGIQRKYNEPCKVWVSGYFGKSNTNYTYVSEVILPGNCFDTIVPKPFIENTVFPNPTIHESEIHFTLDETQEITIDIVNSKGSLVRKLYQDKGKKGKNSLTFNTFHLNAGIYFIRIYSEDKMILSKKLMKR